MLTIYICIAATVLLLPALIIFLLTFTSSRSEIPFELLNDMEEVPEEHKVRATQSFKNALDAHDRSMFYDITAPYVMLFVLPFMKKEANHLPRAFRKWDNEVSINGDRYPWYQEKDADGNVIWVGIKGEIPVGDTCVLWSNEANDNIEVDAKTLAYWVGGKFHPRSFWARYVWLGIRNRASQASCDEGFIVTDELKATFQSWGDPEVGEKTESGEHITGSYLRNVGEHYQLFAMHPVKIGIRRTHFGFKIGNVINDPDRLTKAAMPIAIGFSYRK